MDLGHTILGGLVVATGAALMGKFISNKQIAEKLDKLEQKLDGLVRTEICTTKHNSLEKLVSTQFELLSKKVDRLNSK